MEVIGTVKKPAVRGLGTVRLGTEVPAVPAEAVLAQKVPPGNWAAYGAAGRWEAARVEVDRLHMADEEGTAK